MSTHKSRLNLIVYQTSYSSQKKLYSSLFYSPWKRWDRNERALFLIPTFIFLSPLSPPPVISLFLFPLLIILISSSHGFQGVVQLFVWVGGPFLCKQQPGWGKIVKFMWFIRPDRYSPSDKQDKNGSLPFVVFHIWFLFKFTFGLIRCIAIQFFLWHQGQWTDLQNPLLFSQRVKRHLLKPFGHACLLSSAAALDSLDLPPWRRSTKL